MDSFRRRDIGEGLAAFAAMLAAGRLGATGGAEAATRRTMVAKAPLHDMSEMPAYWRGKERIAFLIYPGFTALDTIGPHYMLTNLMGATTEIVAKTKEPVKSDAGLTLTPSVDFAGAAREVDILCIPGGTAGTLAAMRDEETLAFVASVGARARFVTSVCTGSMILGAAGLLDGYKATSHWVTKPLLPIFGATPTDGRFVTDRNRITAEGVTAGLDFSLALVGKLRDRTYAESVQLLAQYAPQPPFDAGEPSRAPKNVTSMVEGMFVGLVADMREAGTAAMAKAGPPRRGER